MHAEGPSDGEELRARLGEWGVWVVVVVEEDGGDDGGGERESWPMLPL